MGLLSYTMEKAMAAHSSTLAWKIPWMEEPGRLQSIVLLRVGHDFTFTSTFHFHALGKEMATHSTVLAWRIPGTGSLVGCRLWVAQSRTRLMRLSSSNTEDLGSVPGLERSSGEGNGDPLQYSCLENPIVEEPGGL